MHRNHEFLHKERKVDGTVSLGNIVRTLRKNVPRTRVHGVASLAMPVEHINFLENGVVEMYRLMNHVHQDDKRMEKNPLTGELYPFTEHTTCVASMLANLGYDYTVVQAGLGHDLKDKHNDFDLMGLWGVSEKKLTSLDSIEEILKNINFEKVVFDPEAIIMIHAATDLKTLRWGGQTFTKSEEKENALMDKLSQLIPYPHTIALMGADRLHNLLSFDAYSPEQQRRILRETMQYTMPVVKNFDTRLYKALEKRVSELNSELNVNTYTNDPLTLHLASLLITNFAEARARNGVPMQKMILQDIKDEYQSLLDNRLASLNAIQEFAVHAKGPFVNAPNLPKFGDLSIDEKMKWFELIRSTIFEANMSGTVNGRKLDDYGIKGHYDPKNAYDFKVVEGLYPNVAWINNTIEFITTLIQSRINKRVIEAYFEDLEFLPSETTISRACKESVKDNFGQAHITSYKTISGEDVNRVVIYSRRDYFDIAKTIKESLNQEDPMVILEKTFGYADCKPLIQQGCAVGATLTSSQHDFNKKDITGLRIIYDYGGIVSKARKECEKKDGARWQNAPVPPRPYTIVDVIGSSI